MAVSSCGTPIHWVRAPVHVTFLVKQNKAKLGAAPIVWVHRFVFGGPIYACTHLQNAFLHHGDVFFNQLDAPCAELVWRNVAFAYVSCFFNLDFYAQAVAVPALREKHVEALHAFVAGNHVKVGPIQNVAHVQFARRVRRRSIYAKGNPLFVVPVIMVNAHFFPFLLPLTLNFCKVVFFRQRLGHSILMLVFDFSKLR